MKMDLIINKMKEFPKYVYFHTLNGKPYGCLKLKEVVNSKRATYERPINFGGWSIDAVVKNGELFAYAPVKGLAIHQLHGDKMFECAEEEFNFDNQ